MFLSASIFGSRAGVYRRNAVRDSFAQSFARVKQVVGICATYEPLRQGYAPGGR